MRLEDLGEKKILASLIEFVSAKNLLPNDDSSAIKINKKNLEADVLITNTDGFVESTDAPLGMMPFHYGEKVAHMTLSDIVVKGGKPLGIMLSISIPSKEQFIKLYEIVEGAVVFSKKFSVSFLGGDLNQANDLVIDGFAFGVVKRKDLIKRSGANIGDLIVTAPWFGYTYLGLDFLINGKDLDIPSEILRKSVKEVYSPKPWLKQFQKVLQKIRVTSSIDSSDGLAKSLHELARQSEKTFLINRLPIAKDIRRIIPKEMYLTYTMFGGEEFCPVFTIKRKDKDILPRGFIIIGEVKAGAPDVRYVKDGEEISIPDKGWNHFKKNKKEN